MGLAVALDATMSGYAPALEVSLLDLLEHLCTAAVFWATIHHPGQPLTTHAMNKEVKKASERYANNGINLTGVLVSLVDKPMLEECCHLESSSIKSLVLRIVITWVDGIEVNFGQVAVEIAAKDFAAGVKAVAVHAVLQFTLVHVVTDVLSGHCKQLHGGLSPQLGVGLQEVLLEYWTAQQVGIRASHGLRDVLNSTLA